MAGKTYPKRDPGRCPSHPGAVLREIILPEVRVTKSAIAAALKLSRNQLHMILSEKQPVTPETAVKLEAAFGGSARMWLAMQAAYDLWHAQQKVDVKSIPSMRAA
jgi:addiction module HigA family antidote